MQRKLLCEHTMCQLLLIRGSDWEIADGNLLELELDEDAAEPSELPGPLLPLLLVSPLPLEPTGD